MTNSKSIVPDEVVTGFVVDATIGMADDPFAYIANRAAAWALELAARNCENLHALPGWNSHYRNASMQCANAIRAMIPKEGE